MFDVIRRVIVACLLAVAMMAAVSSPAGARGVTQIAGSATAAGGNGAGECDGATSLFTLVLEGDLEGCWYTTDLQGMETPSGVYMERGAEKFVGTWMGEEIEFTTTYKFTAKFDAEGNEIHGRCQHPVDTGDVEGRIDFKDDVETGIFYYRGHLR